MPIRPEELRKRADALEEENEQLMRSLRPILNKIDKEAEMRGRSQLDVIDRTAKINDLVAEAKRKGAPLNMLRAHAQTMDREKRELRPVSRQAIHLALRAVEGRESRPTPEPKPAGRINAAALK